MRALLAAAVSLAAAAAAAHAHASVPRVQTLYPVQGGSIVGFAQDGPLFAVFVKANKGCNAVRVRSVANSLAASVPNPGLRNVTCTWQIGRRSIPVAIDLNADTIWSLRQSSPLVYDYLIGAGTGHGDQRERRLQQLAHTSKGAGLWLGGMVGDGNTLAYAVTSVDYQDEAGCLAGTGTCAMTIDGGGVYRITGWRLKPVYKKAAVNLAASGNSLAIVPTDSVTKSGQPVAGADLPIDVIDATTGNEISSVQPQGTPVAIALSANVLATLERTPLGTRVAWYDPTTGQATGSAPVAAATATDLTTSDKFIVFHVGRSIRSIDIASGQIRTLATATSTPIGLSLDGNRLAWAENVKNGGRVRALYLGGS